MKRRKKRRILRIRMLALLSLLCMLLSSCTGVSSYVGAGSPEEDGGVAELERDNYQFLLLGKDRSGNLTDVMMLVSLQTKQLTAGILQIPRDTYAAYTERTYKKLNGAMSHLGIDGLRDFLEGALGIRIDRHLVLDLASFSEIVDAVGGIRINLPEDLSYEDPAQDLHISLQKGEQVLDGKAAEQFVRYRSGYLKADLARMDAQKLFMVACMQSVRSNLSLPVIVKTVRALYGRVETDLTFSECCAFATALFRTDLSDISLTTLAGEAVKTEAGSWYYIINRDCAEEQIRQLFDAKRAFDPENVFTDPANTRIHSVYRKKQSAERIYRADEINQNGIPIRMNPKAH